MPVLIGDTYGEAKEMAKTVDWTEDLKAELRQHWLLGLSAAAIAGQMGRGLTRNAVIGKASRLKLPGRNVITRMCVIRVPRTTSFRAPPKPRSPLQKLRKLPDYQAPPTVDPMECGTIPLTDLEPHQCRFAAGDPAPGEKHLFCGKPTMPSFPYCEAHVQRCYQIDKPRSTRPFYRGLRPLTVANVYVPA